MNPIGTLRTTKLYPVPPVCSAAWTEEDWERTAVYVTEPATLTIPGLGRFVAVGRDDSGTLVYSKDTTP